MASTRGVVAVQDRQFLYDTAHSHMSWKDHTPRPNNTVMIAIDVSPASHARPGILVTSQAPSSEIAPIAGT